MRKILLAATLTLVPALFSTGKAMAQTIAQYGTEVCVNESLAVQAKQRFPNARIHIVPDSSDPQMNGWRIVSGSADASGTIHTDAQEVELRSRDRDFAERFFSD